MRPLSVLGAAALTASSVLASSPPVQVELRTSWPSPPFLVELLETIAIEEPGSFFRLLDRFTHPEWSPLAESKTNQEIYQTAIKDALSSGFLSEPGELASMEMTFALHSAVPKIEAAYQYYAGSQAARGADCESWVDWYGEVVCDVETLQRLAGVETIESGADAPRDSSLPQPKLLPFDHVSPSPEHVLERPPHTAILYATLTSPNFRPLHEFLYKASNGDGPQLEYVFRHAPPSGHASSEDRTYLSGYGVALDLKKMEYLAVDDRRQGSSAGSVDSEDTSASTYDTDPITTLLHQYPEDPAADYTTPLTEDELFSIGLEAAQLVRDADNALAALKHLAQDFPRYASTLARRVVVTDALEREITANQAKAQGGVNVIWLNGAQLGDADMNPFSLLRLMRKERGIMKNLMSLGLNATQALDLLTHKAVGLAQSDSGVLDGLFDASDRPEGGTVIGWCNDLETDPRYARWSPSILSLRNIMLYPGQMPSLRLNLYNVVLVMDLAQPTSLHFIGGAVTPLIARGFPFRFGIVPSVETEEARKMARLFYWLLEHVGRDRALAWMSRIPRIQPGGVQEPASIDWRMLDLEFASLLDSVNASADAPIEATLDAILAGEDEESVARIDAARAYARRLSADTASAPTGHVFVNGKHFELDDDTLRNMQVVATQMFQFLQERLFYNELTEDDSARMSTYFYDRPEASLRRNRYIYPGTKTGDLRIANLLEVLERSRFPSRPGSFVYPPNNEQLAFTAFVVADLDSEEGLGLVTETLRSMTEDSPMRISFVHNPAAKQAPAGFGFSVESLLGHLITQGTLSKLPPAKLLDVITRGARAAPAQSDQVVLALERDVLAGASPSALDDAAFVQASRRVLRELKLQPGEQALVVNGRIVGPIESGGLIAEDMAQLVAYEHRKRVGPVTTALEEVLGSFEAYDRASLADLVALASSLISSIHLPDPSEVGLFNAPIKPRRRNYQLLGGEHTKFEYGDNSTALLHFGILLDPISEAAQKWASLLEWVLNDPAVFVELHVNPGRYGELPLKRFYRYNVLPALQFSESGEEMKAEVVFNGLPEEPIYTLAMDIPPSWLVRPREASYDLDNIILSGLSSLQRVKGVHAVFDLDYLVIEGHAREDKTMSPPRGLQLQLTSGDGTAIADTLVVANLGYLQFRAKPGVFQFEIRPGRGRDIFQLESVGSEGWNSPTVNEIGNEVALTSFEGLVLYPRVARLPGMESVDVLAPEVSHEHQDSTIVGKLKASFSSLFASKPQPESGNEVVEAKKQADINIFTVASGLLYERFASIMILSVLRNTKSTVKFWFIENFLSPSFLEFIPHFAEAYGFQYELVTYKWPSWLREQKEKQRIIWAYKILFLDVLFPMDLEKVIFVDADQIVRADLKELVDLDLHGAPYGYTPMGDDNEEMEGFRFWKTGYWNDFLQGLPYHISALYVVDLVRFRQMAAGDILRGHYQQLSADPNSLANLDQDLPNNLQREVPIFSLPEDWLWCETWCSKDRLHRAKTIDLCQNPLTKEPKLARAKHIPEWEQYDAEIAQFARKLAESGLIHSGMADADAAALASVGTGKAAAPSEQDAVEPTDSDTQTHVKDEL